MAGFAGGRTAALYKDGEAQEVPVLTSLCPSSLVSLFKFKNCRGCFYKESGEGKEVGQKTCGFFSLSLSVRPRWSPVKRLNH